MINNILSQYDVIFVMNLIKNLKIKTKIKLILYNAIFIIISMSISFFIFSSYLTTNFDNMKKQELYFKNNTYDLTILIANLHKDILTSSILNTTDESIIEDLEDNNEVILEKFQIIEGLLHHNVSKNTKNTLAILNKLKIRYKSYYNNIRLLPNSYKNSQEDGMDLLIGINEISKKMFEELEIFAILADKKFNSRIEYIKSSLNNMTMIFLLLAFGSLIVFLFFTHLLKNTINESLHNFDAGIEKFFDFLSQKRNNVTEIQINYNDELGEIAQHVNENIASVKVLINNERDFKKTLEKEVKIQTQKLHELNDEILSTQKDVVAKMGAIAETRSKETGDHVKRVASYSKLFGEKIGLSEDECELLYGASPMHDIGKVGIPDNILNKPGKLTKEEFEIMKSHTQLGYEMLSGSSREILSTAAIISKEHHEKWNGTGYPDQLAGEDIHIYGRITAIADVFDALGSDRCYKKAWPLEKILDLIKEEKGKHFDPKLVDIFFDNLDEFLAIRDKFKG